MAEVLGVVSSIIAIVGVAGKLGTSTFKLKRLWDEVQDVPTSIQRCIEQLEILAPAIQDMEFEFERTREMVQNDTAARTSLEYSQRAMETLEALTRDMEGRIESARRGKKLLTQLKVRLKKDVLEEHQQRLQFALQLVSLSQQTYLIAVTRAQPSIIMTEWKSLQEQERTAQHPPAECSDEDEESATDATDIVELPSNNRVPAYSNWWPTVKTMPWRKPGVMGSLAYRAEEEESEECTHLSRRNVRVHQARLQLPRWMLQKTWDFQFYRSYDGWRFQLKNWNIRPKDSPIFRFVQEGRTDLVLEAFDRNEASLYDVDEHGITLIQTSILFGQHKLTKNLHLMGLKTSDIEATKILLCIMWWIHYSRDDGITMELLDLCKEGEEFSSLVDLTPLSVEITGSVLAFLLDLRFALPTFSMFPPEQSACISTYGFDWSVAGPKNALSMLTQGFVRPNLLRQTNLDGFACAYFHALLNDAETESWRLLARKIFAGAEPREVALPLYRSLDCLPLLCGALARIKWRKFPMGAFNKWVSSALSMWMEDLAEAGADLQEYLRMELSACRGADMQLQPGTRLLGSGPSLVVLSYGDNPEDWKVEWDPCVEEVVGEFWNIIEFPLMPGAWVDDSPDGEPEDKDNRCYMGDRSLCVMASIRYWGEIQRSGGKLNSSGPRGILRCERFQGDDWFRFRH